MDVDNQEEVSKIVLAFRKRFPTKNIWVFTGYVLEKDLDPGRPMYTHYTPIIMDNTMFWLMDRSSQLRRI